MGVDGKGEQVLDVRTITLENREVEGDDDRVVRRSLRAASGQRLRDIADQVWASFSGVTIRGPQRLQHVRSKFTVDTLCLITPTKTLWSSLGCRKTALDIDCKLKAKNKVLSPDAT